MGKKELSFGQRVGASPIKFDVQLKDLNSQTRIDLYNKFLTYIGEPYKKAFAMKDGFLINYKMIWAYFLGKKLDQFPRYSYFIATIDNFIDNSKWYEVYELFEFILNRMHDALFDISGLAKGVNLVLEENNAGYRFANGLFIPITSDIELKEIETTGSLGTEYAIPGISEHLRSAIAKLAEKPQPDIRNSIKESISMVEATMRHLTGESTFGKALHKLNSSLKLDPILKSSIEKQYAFTNGKEGIRHALMQNENIGLSEARFFLISCSAFTNLLIYKAFDEGML